MIQPIKRYMIGLAVPKAEVSAVKETLSYLLENERRHFALPKTHVSFATIVHGNAVRVNLLAPDWKEHQLDRLVQAVSKLFVTDNVELVECNHGWFETGARVFLGGREVQKPETD